jgi:hypothetical protein
VIAQSPKTPDGRREAAPATTAAAARIGGGGEPVTSAQQATAENATAALGWRSNVVGSHAPITCVFSK